MWQIAKKRCWGWRILQIQHNEDGLIILGLGPLQFRLENSWLELSDIKLSLTRPFVRRKDIVSSIRGNTIRED